MNILDLIKSWFYSVKPTTKLPKLKNMRRILDNASAKDWKVSSVVFAKCGILLATYHNITREDAAINLVDPKTGKSKQLLRNNNETFGRPVLRNDGWWYYPCENRGTGIVRIRDSDGKAETTRVHQPEGYSACGLNDEFAISKTGREGGSKPRWWNYLTGKSGYANKKLHGIASAACIWKGEKVCCVSDGAESGVESDAGWAISDDLVSPRENWATPTINIIGNWLIAFRKNGTVMKIVSGKPIKTELIGNIGKKPCRSVSTGSLIYWSTSNKDALAVTNGKDVSVLWEAPGSDLSDGTSSGNLFDTDVAVSGKTLAYARSQQNSGFEVWLGEVE